MTTDNQENKDTIVENSDLEQDTAPKEVHEEASLAEPTPEELAEENPEIEVSDTKEQPKEEAEPDLLEKLQAELREQKDKYVRLYAEFENFRRRTVKEKADTIKNASEGMIKDLLPVIDDFERALKSMQNSQKQEFSKQEDALKEIKAIEEGIVLIFNKLYKTLENKGLKPIDSAVGKDFNIEEHESITSIPAPSEEMKGKVIDEIEKGYYLHDKVLRFTKVILGS